jgi:hypothetical protein
MMRTDCLGRMSGRPKPADQARPLAEWRGKVKALALVRAKKDSAGDFNHFSGITGRRTRATGAAARRGGFALVGSGADLAIRICIIASTIVALDRNWRRQNGRIKSWAVAGVGAIEAIGIVLHRARCARSAILAAGAQAARRTGFADEGIFRWLESSHALIV